MGLFQFSLVIGDKFSRYFLSLYKISKMKIKLAKKDQYTVGFLLNNSKLYKLYKVNYTIISFIK